MVPEMFRRVSRGSSPASLNGFVGCPFLVSANGETLISAEEPHSLDVFLLYFPSGLFGQSAGVAEEHFRGFGVVF